MLREQRRRLLGKSPILLVQFGAESPDRAAAAGEYVLVREHRLHTGAQPLLRRTGLIPGPPQGFEFLQALLDNRFADRLFRLEVVIDIAQRYLGLLRDIGEARLPEPVPVGHLHGGLNQSRSVILSGRRHELHSLVSWLTNFSLF